MKRCLIVSGGWAGHRGYESGERLRALLEEDGFRVVHSDTLATYETADFHGFDLIVPNWTVGSISAEASKRLWDAIWSGVGLGGFHGGMVDGLKGDDRFRFMVGGAYVREPGGICNYTVNVARPDDPIMAGIEDFEYRSEQYYMHVDPANEVLATTTFSGTDYEWIAGVTMPTVWKKPLGKGRVFFSALGHSPDEFDVATMTTILRRGLAWASR